MSFGSAAAVLGGSVAWRLRSGNIPPTNIAPTNVPQTNIVTSVKDAPIEAAIEAVFDDMPTSSAQMSAAVQQMLGPAPDRLRYLTEFSETNRLVPAGDDLARYLNKMSNFEHFHDEDVFLANDQRPLLAESFKRIDRVQSLVGHGNFNVLGFDDMLRHAEQYESVGAFTKPELNFLEGLFFDDVERYGFMGEKVIDSLTAVVSERDRKKISHTGHFLFKGRSEEIYSKIRRDVGDSIVLTSGIRGIVKQTHLFLAKTIQSEGNLSLASRSLAPPGHSFHGVGDFDVGKVGLGARNFTADFSSTDEFRKLVDLGYLDIRYPEKNLLGVRYEPWHIKVV
tara:strand:- start:13797 stop:14807 length:1011 start_codon:yes stop_codon:yes gene_type:complete